MDSRTTKLKLKYRIEERPGVGWAAISDDPGIQPIEAATKAELFEKLRERTAALIGSQLPMNFDTADAVQTGVPVERKVVVNIDAKRRLNRENPEYVAGTDPTPLASQSSGTNIWRIFFFLLLAAVAGWLILHHR